MEGIKVGQMEWTGDNPFIYLKTSEEQNWSSLTLYFRIASSVHGSGKAILVLEQPYESNPEHQNRFMLTDNLPLAKYLVSDFVRHFGLFRKAIALDEMKYIDNVDFSTENRFPEQVIESAYVKSMDLQVDMVWNNLQNAICVDLPAHLTQTLKHEMMCVFHPALTAQVLINGQALAGQTIERDFNGTRAQSASLANSETWIRVKD